MEFSIYSPYFILIVDIKPDFTCNSLNKLFNNEEIVVFRSLAGANVGPHCGATNNQINLHLTLTGGAGTVLQVGQESFQLKDESTVCFQDGYVHSLRGGPGPRRTCAKEFKAAV